LSFVIHGRSQEFQVEKVTLGQLRGTKRYFFWMNADQSGSFYFMDEENLNRKSAWFRKAVAEGRINSRQRDLLEAAGFGNIGQYQEPSTFEATLNTAPEVFPAREIAQNKPTPAVILKPLEKKMKPKAGNCGIEVEAAVKAQLDCKFIKSRYPAEIVRVELDPDTELNEDGNGLILRMTDGELLIVREKNLLRMQKEFHDKKN
jgi:hypothetical protein